MFPTHVGMNLTVSQNPRRAMHVPHTRGDEPATRPNLTTKPHVPHTRGDEPYAFANSSLFSLHVPHTRGDEPHAVKSEQAHEQMFPTHVGMNRLHYRFRSATPHVPHTRGDEP